MYNIGMSQPPPIPVPVQQLSYGMPEGGRPGLVTGIGVASIVLASIGILSSCGGLAMSRAFMMLSSARTARMASTSTSSSVVVNGGNTTAPIGAAPPMVVASSSSRSAPGAVNTGVAPSPSPAAMATADGLAALEPLTVAQRGQLLAMIADRGDWYLGGPNDAGEWTADDMRKSVKLHGKLVPSAGEANAGTYFQLPEGRLELHDDYATYLGKGLDPLTVRQTIQPGGAYSVTTTQGGAVGNTTVSYRSSGRAMPPIKFSGRVLELSAALGVANGLLAIFLFIAGIMTLANSGHGRRLHLIYAVIKLPLVIAGGIIGAMMVSSVFAAAPSASGLRGLVAGFALAGAVIPAIYPIVLFFVLQAQSVRHWFATRP